MKNVILLRYIYGYNTTIPKTKIRTDINSLTREQSHKVFQYFMGLLESGISTHPPMSKKRPIFRMFNDGIIEFNAEYDGKYNEVVDGINKELNK